MILNILIFCVALYMVIKGSTMSTVYASSLAKHYRIPKYTVAFIIVAVISILPETFIAINSALTGVPTFGLGMILGSNIADLTLIFAILIFYTGREIKVESKILANQVIYPFILLIPGILGLNGHFSRLEGLALIVAGGVFYYVSLKSESKEELTITDGPITKYKSMLMFLVSMSLLLVGAHFTVNSATSIANSFNVSPILISMFIVGLGTTMPELFFSIKALKNNDDSLAIGDILGTVLADATIVIGLIALINPFSFPTRIIYVSGVFMVISSFILFKFMRSGKTVTWKEAIMLLSLWFGFVILELLINL